MNTATLTQNLVETIMMDIKEIVSTEDNEYIVTIDSTEFASKRYIDSEVEHFSLVNGLDEVEEADDARILADELSARLTNYLNGWYLEAQLMSIYQACEDICEIKIDGDIEATTQQFMDFWYDNQI